LLYVLPNCQYTHYITKLLTTLCLALLRWAPPLRHYLVYTA